MLIAERHLRCAARLAAVASGYIAKHHEREGNLDSEEARVLIGQAIGILQGVRDGMAPVLPQASSVTVVETPCGQA